MDGKLKLVVILTATSAGLALALPVAAYVAPSLVGADQALIVLTGSMEPTLSPGDVVLVAPVAIDEVAVGDVVTYRPHPDVEKTYTHRVIDVTRDQRGTVLTTQGDANEDPDPLGVDQAMLVGRVEHTIPWMGRAIAAAQAPIMPLLLVVGAILTIGWEVRNLLQAWEEPGEPRRFDLVAQRRATPSAARRFQVVRRR